MKNKAHIIIDDCTKCPHLSFSPNYGMDGNVITENFFCNINNPEQPTLIIENVNEEDLEIPDWCPLIVKYGIIIDKPKMFKIDEKNQLNDMP
jgi:hypothetical protein